MKRDFRNFHRSRNHFGMSAFDDYTRALDRGPQSRIRGYVSPTIIEERQLNVTQMDVFSRLMMERIIFFGDEVNSQTSNIIVSQLLYLDQVSDAKITMHINSPGGSVYDGYGIIDTMDYINPAVATINTGMAASMGAMLLMCGEEGERSSLPHARTMIHQPLGGASGQASDIEITAREIMKLKKELYEIISARTGQPFDVVEAACDRDNWMTSQEALDFGIIDNIVTKKA